MLAQASLANEHLDLNVADVVNLIGIADTASEGVISQQRIANIPLSRLGKVLEQVPSQPALGRWQGQSVLFAWL